MLEIKLKRLSTNAVIPQNMTTHASGYDIYSSNQNDIILKAGKVKLIPTGIAISIPPGYEAQIRPRSGLAIKHQIGILNAPGTIDSDYRGEIKVILFNFGDKDYVIKPQSRIAQMVIAKIEKVGFSQVKELDKTERNAGGFGSTKI